LLGAPTRYRQGTHESAAETVPAWEHAPYE
jgi:hypothetical protein